MKKLNGKSMDLVQENIKKLKEIFPEVFVEGEVNFDVLRQIFGGGLDTSKERYSLNWNGKSEARQRALEASTGTLRPAKEESKNWDNTENIYIEGDNLEVLKLLQKSYYGKIKMIYIDPPYNTGKDFVYKDNFKDSIENYKEITGQVNKEGVKLTTNTETNGRYHSDWLSMMYPRLKLARSLLTDDGVIFISIDENEVANLKKICEEIFGGENFVACCPRKTRGSATTKSDAELQKLNDYLLIFWKNKSISKFNLKYVGKKEYPYRDERGDFYIVSLQDNGPHGTKTARPNLFYPIYYDKNTKVFSLDKKDTSIEFLPKKHKNDDGTWMWSKSKFIKDSRDLYLKNNQIYIKHYYDENEDQNKYQRNKSFLDNYQNTTGTKILKSLFENSGIFNNPKPIKLLDWCLRLCTNKNSMVLDFFSGSATTAHSVMQLNAEDGGNRKYIMVQLPELCKEDSEAYKAGYKNICEIGKERIRRAGDKIKEDETLPLENREKLDIGFKVFKLDSSNIKEWDTDTNDLQQSLLDSVENIKSDRNSLDVLYEILVKYGLDLNVPIKETKNFYSIGGGTLLVSLNNEINLDVINSICEEYKKILEINKEFKTTVILRDNSFKNDVDKTNALKRLEQVGINEVRSI